MDMSVVGGAFLSASLNVMFDRLASREFINFFQGQKYNERVLKKLKILMLRVKPLLDDAENKQWTDPAEKDCVVEVKDDATDEAVRSKSDSEFPTSSISTAQAVSDILVSWSPFDEDVESKIEQIIEILEHFVNTKDSLGQQTQITMYSREIDACEIVGPFGGRGGNIWDDRIHTTIKQIKLHHGSRINSIQIEYDNNEESKWSDLHGKCDGEEITIKLNFPIEFLVSISGRYNTTGDSNTAVVQSLTIRSNSKVYGPYGKEEGQPFSTSSAYGKIIGLFGKSDTYVNSIGFYIKPHRSISIGPFGGFGGQQWNDGITYTTIRQIMISYGDVIHSIKIEYDLNGKSTWSNKHGESVGSKLAMVKLDYPSEFLINISGYCTEDSSGSVVRSLTIESNKQKYGPFGAEHGKHFSTTSTGGKITGFHGRSGLSLDSIAAYFEASEFLSIGPFGGFGGGQWDDGTYTGIREIYIHHEVVIDSIQMVYDKDGQSINSALRGGPGGQLVEVKLDYPKEYLISISGYCYKDANLTVIRSLIIQSNKKQYGPYGSEKGEYFSTSSTGGKIVGFYGRSGLYLDSIGAHYEPLQASIQQFPNP